MMNKNTVILDGLSTPDEINTATTALIAILKDNQIPHKCYNVSDSDMGLCIACGYCGTKNPGLCFRKDDAADYTARLAQSTLFIILTKVHYGALEASVKLAMDRIALFGTAYFTIRGGKLFHKARYKTASFNLLVLASPEWSTVEKGTMTEAVYISDQEKQNFEALIKRDSEHLCSPRCDVLWLPKTPEQQNELISHAILSMTGDINERQAN